MIICFSQTNAKNHRPKNTQLKVYQDRGMVIVVINHDDLQQVAKGISFIKMLRAKYEAVRLDLISTRS
jgi:hypothetical protein